MNRFITLALVLFASTALVHCGVYKSGPGAAVQQVDIASLSNLANLGSYLGGTSGANTGATASALAAAPAQVLPAGPAYGAAPKAAYAPATSIVAPGPAYGAGPGSAYGGAPALNYGNAGSIPALGNYGGALGPAGYGAGPKYNTYPAFAAQLYPGQNSYKAYQSPAQFSTIALPVIPDRAVAKLFLPQQAAYNTPASYNLGTGY